MTPSEITLIRKTIMQHIDIQCGSEPPDVKAVAQEIAKYILQNGFIARHGPIILPDSDDLRYRFSLVIFKPEIKLP